MRAGKLDKSITLERLATVVDDYGTPSEGWTEIAKTKAQLLQSSTEEFLKSAGTEGQTAVIFRIRWRDGLRVSDRVTLQGQEFNIVEIKELGRREGIDLRCTATA